MSELIQRVRAIEGRRWPHACWWARRLAGALFPATNVVAASDFLLIHGNGAKQAGRITDLIRKTRALPTYRPMPVLINEDDHENFDQPENNFTAALREHVSWGWFDYRRKGEGWTKAINRRP